MFRSVEKVSSFEIHWKSREDPLPKGEVKEVARLAITRISSDMRH